MAKRSLKNLAGSSSTIDTSTNRRFQFHKRRQLFIRTHNETLSVAAICVNNPDDSPLRINRCDAAPTPSRFAEVVSDYFPEYVATLEYG
ncbi:MAG: hypothetical protein DMC59_09550 [Verrucomicrobia bacterium]|nr:MAG: hypothetical protein DMC59_09550 [Verrucomicrobiota bacterium]PYL27952.1 MAG: hypothetical protein DMF39_09885 [Verrucomicrobiota bacterium]